MCVFFLDPAWGLSGKMPPGGQAEIENVQSAKVTFQFQLCHQVTLLNFEFTFPIYGPLVKKVSDIFLYFTKICIHVYQESWSCSHGRICLLPDYQEMNSESCVSFMWQSFCKCSIYCVHQWNPCYVLWQLFTSSMGWTRETQFRDVEGLMSLEAILKQTGVIPLPL